MIIFSYHTFPIEAQVYIFVYIPVTRLIFFTLLPHNMHKDGRQLHATEIPCKVVIE